MQAGSATDLYHNPDNLLVAEVFSDPPLNIVGASKKEGIMSLDGGDSKLPLTLPSVSPFLQLANGQYSIAFRAHNLHDKKPEVAHVSFDGVVQITEIAGSESFIHISVCGHDWVMQTTNIKPHDIGESLLCYIRLQDIMIFDHNKQRIDGADSYGGH